MFEPKVLLFLKDCLSYIISMFEPKENLHVYCVIALSKIKDDYTDVHVKAKL